MHYIDEWVARRNDLTATLYDRPYDLVTYIERAISYARLGYHDLAAGDAYRALRLTDEVLDESAEYHDQAEEALIDYHDRQKHSGAHDGDEWVTVASLGTAQENNTSNEDISPNGTEEAILDLTQQKASQCFALLAESLFQCGCLKSALDFTNRGLAASPGHTELLGIRARVYDQARKVFGKDASELDINELPDQGRARRETYPWNAHEPDRFSHETLEYLNGEMSKIAPKCEVKVAELPNLAEADLDARDRKMGTVKQLGIFANADVEPEEVLLHEKSGLIANNRLYESLCDACSSAFPDITTSQEQFDSEAASKVVSCPDCQGILFCDEDCLKLAQETYHPAVCDKEVETIGKRAPLKETSEALYLLLLLRAIAMAETQSTHPLELNEVKYIWGEFLPPNSKSQDQPHNATLSSTDPSSTTTNNATLPFSFTYNIASPLLVLELLDLDIFALLPHYDLWILNTLYAKFRGTASARVSLRDGRPEVCAVHPMWCLANHSCDPNVAWEWGAEMKFWARGRRVSRAGEEADDGISSSSSGAGVGDEARHRAGKGGVGGIREGEEVLNHYCDIDLPVKERREWAVGSLGGWCMCDRCRREEKEE